MIEIDLEMKPFQLVLVLVSPVVLCRRFPALPVPDQYFPIAPIADPYQETLTVQPQTTCSFLADVEVKVYFAILLASCHRHGVVFHLHLCTRPLSNLESSFLHIPVTTSNSLAYLFHSCPLAYLETLGLTSQGCDFLLLSCLLLLSSCELVFLKQRDKLSLVFTIRSSPFCASSSTQCSLCLLLRLLNLGHATTQFQILLPPHLVLVLPPSRNHPPKTPAHSLFQQTLLRRESIEVERKEEIAGSPSPLLPPRLLQSKVPPWKIFLIPMNTPPSVLETLSTRGETTEVMKALTAMSSWITEIKLPCGKGEKADSTLLLSSELV